MSEAGAASIFDPPSGHGPGVLVLHGPWGLTDGIRSYCRSLSDAGFQVVAPDLFDGAVAATAEEADAQLTDADPSRLTVLVQAGARALYEASHDELQKLGVVGFSMGGSLALWAAARLPLIFDRAVSYYGVTSIDFSGADARFLGHFAAADELVSEDDQVYTESLLRLGGHETAFHRYDDTSHGFAEAGHPDHDAAAADLAMERTVSFLAPS